MGRLAIFALPLISGCGGTTTEVVSDPKIEEYRLVKIAVLPFTTIPPTVGQERGYAAPAPPLSAAENLTELFYRKLNARDGISIIPSYKVREAMGGPAGAPMTKAALRSIGQRLGADAVLTGVVEVYKERAGSAMGLDRPQDAAEVGFVAELISVKDGVTLWTGQYHERQRPANEDITGFLERGPRYLKVDQLADSAVDHVLQKFPLGQPRPKQAVAP
jgi:TolB-like protein